VRVAEGILNGSLIGEPYRPVGRNAAIATVNSAQVVYTLGNLGPESALDKGAYHAIAIPGPSVPTPPAGRFAGADAIKSTLYLIRDYAQNTMYLIVGSQKALLVGSGSGTPGLAAFVKRLAGAVPVEVIVTSSDPGQIGGLAQFTGATVYIPDSMPAPAGTSGAIRMSRGSRIDLGVDGAGRPLLLEIYPLSGHDPSGITLLDTANRVLFGGDALGTQGNDAGLILREPLASFSSALERWRTATDGKYDAVYTAHNFEWFTSPAYVDSLQAAVRRGVSEGEAALVDSVRMPGSKMIRSSGAPDVVASVVVAGASR
jgi:glyoxylase-like metal-dependent hydrolase (beta-lactamase superfamily II)